MSKEANATQLVKIHAGHVIIRNGRKEYNDTVQNFEMDNGAPMPALPAEWIGESYVPGKWHRITNGTKAVSLEMPWAQGEQLLGKLDGLLAAQQARATIPEPSPDPDINIKRAAAMEALLARRAADPDATPEEKDYQTEKRKP